MIHIVFTSRSNPVSGYIKQRTWSDWSHVALHRDGMVIEAAMMRGVRMAVFDEAVKGTEAYLMARVECTEEVEEKVWQLASSQLGKGYDWLAIFGIFFKREWQKDDKWVCHELIAWAFKNASFELLQASHLNRLTPQHLLLSPFVRWRDG